MEGLVHDLRFGIRALWRKPGFTLVAAVTLALGIGANVTMLSVTSALLFRELPLRDPERVMALWRHTPRQSRSPFSIPTFRDWHERNRAFESLAMFRPCGQNLVGGDGEPERISGLMVSAEFPQALGIEPLLGRTFRPEDDRLGAERTVMLDHELWQRRFGGDPDLVGRTVNLDGERYTVIAVLPPGLRRERLGSGTALGDVWLPIGVFFDRLPAEERASRDLEGVGRLKPGVTFESALEDMARIIRELAAEHPQTYVDNQLVGAPLREDLVRGVRPILQILMAAVGFVLLIACANLINLLLTRAAERDQELATRMALGAGRGRLIRQLLVESLLLALTGGAAGLLAAGLYLRLLPRFVTGVPHVAETRVDGPIVALTLLLALAVSLLIGLVPALQATGSRRQLEVDRRGALQRSALPQQGLRQALVVLELALALVLLIGAGLMLGSLARLRTQDPGFTAAQVLTLQVVLPQAKHDRRFDWTAFFDQALERLRALSDVEEAAVTSLRPMDVEARSIIAAGDRALPRTPELSTATYHLISPGYFRTLAIPLIEGRDFDERDTDRTGQVVLINESLARHFWPGESPQGRLFAFEFLGTPEEPRPQWRRVVGVVDDVRNVRLSEPPGFAAYAPYTQRSPYFEGESPTMTLLVRVGTSREPHDLIKTVLAELREIDRHQPVFSIRPMTDVLTGQLGKPRMLSSLLLSFTILALFLAAVGVYGVVAYNVAARTREIGTRMAFGASPAQVLAVLLKQGLTIVAIGIAIGLAAAAILTRLMTSLLYGVKAIDPGIYLVVGLMLAAVAMLAILLPAWRAMRVQPAEALHYE